MTKAEKRNSVLYIMFGSIAILGLVLIIVVVKGQIPSVKDCLIQSHTNVSSAICAFLAVNTAWKTGKNFLIEEQLHNQKEIKRLTERLDKALRANEEMIARAEYLEDTLNERNDVSNEVIRKAVKLPDADKPVGNEFFRLYVDGTCRGGGTVNFCGGEGEFLRPPPT